MRTASVRFSLPVLLHRRIVPRGVVGARSLSSQPKVNQSRGGLPRFHSPSLPSSEVVVSGISSNRLRSLFLYCLSSFHCLFIFSDDFLLFIMQGDVVRIQGDEFWHMTRVLRLSINDRLFSLNFCIKGLLFILMPV